MAYSKGYLKHPSKAFVDLMINEQTSEQFNHAREEGYASNDMRRYLFHFKDKDLIKEFSW